MITGNVVTWYVLAVGLVMFGLGWWGGYAGLVRRARAAWDDLEAAQDALDQAPAAGPLIAPADLALAASIPGPVPGLAYTPDPARVQLIGGFYTETDFDDQYHAAWDYAAERSRWAAHIIEGIWKGIHNGTDRN